MGCRAAEAEGRSIPAFHRELSRQRCEIFDAAADYHADAGRLDCIEGLQARCRARRGIARGGTPATLPPTSTPSGHQEPS